MKKFMYLWLFYWIEFQGGVANNKKAAPSLPKSKQQKTKHFQSSKLHTLSKLDFCHLLYKLWFYLKKFQLYWPTTLQCLTVLGECCKSGKDASVNADQVLRNWGPMGTDGRSTMGDLGKICPKIIEICYLIEFDSFWFQ